MKSSKRGFLFFRRATMSLLRVQVVQKSALHRRLLFRACHACRWSKDSRLGTLSCTFVLRKQLLSSRTGNYITRVRHADSAPEQGELSWPQTQIGKQHHACQRRSLLQCGPKGDPSGWTGADFIYIRENLRPSWCRGFLHDEGGDGGISLLARNPHLPSFGRARPFAGRALRRARIAAAFSNSNSNMPEVFSEPAN
jgi:hypothetical protein